ncbi:MAG: hypothetical protein PHV59_12515 [Victivallales bacterium]|nr:hypothetical protein [Victivallales bacterium]
MRKKLQIGEIVERSKQLEALLKKLGAEGRGLHEQTSGIQDKLGEKLSGDLRFIATIRNKAVHEPEFDIAADIDAFHAACDEAEKELRELNRPTAKAETGKPRTRKTKTAASAPKFNYLLLLPFIPVLNIIYFIFLLILSMARGAGYLLLLMLYLTAFATAGYGICSHNRALFYTGTGIFAAAYIANIFNNSPRFPKLRYLPLLNMLVIAERLTRKIRWRLFFTAMLLLTGTVISGFLIFSWNKTTAGIIIFLAAYLAGIIFFVLAGKRKKTSGKPGIKATFK